MLVAPDDPDKASEMTFFSFLSLFQGNYKQGMNTKHRPQRPSQEARFFGLLASSAMMLRPNSDAFLPSRSQFSFLTHMKDGLFHVPSCAPGPGPARS